MEPNDSPAPSRSARRGSKPVVWLLAGCLGIPLLVISLVLTGSYLMVRKGVREAKLKSIEKQLQGHSRFELAAAENDLASITVRDRLTGTSHKLAEADVEAKGLAAILATLEKEYTTIPPWVPVYPGGLAPHDFFLSNALNVLNGYFTQTTEASVQRVAAYSRSALQKEGFRVLQRPLGSGAEISAVDAAGGRRVQMTIREKVGRRQVTTRFLLQ